MQTSCKTGATRLGAGVMVFVLLVCIGSWAQKSEMFHATAYGTGTQLGRNLDVKIIVESYSTPEDQQVLLNALKKGGTDAVTSALDKMPNRGRISLPGTVGYVVSYVRVWSTPTGRRIRLITSRPIAIGEAWNSTRSSDYSVSAIELEVNNDMKKTTGTLMPAIKLKITKENEIEVEAFQNPWRLGNFIDWGK